MFAKCIMKHLPNIVIMKKCDTVFNHNRPYVSLDERRRMSDSYLITIRQLFSRKVFLRGEVSLYHFASCLLAIPTDNQRIPSYDTSAISLKKYHGSITISGESIIISAFGAVK